MARSIVITKRTNGGITCVRDGVMTNRWRYAGYLTFEEGSNVGVVITDINGVPFFNDPYAPDLWTIDGVSGFTTIEEVCNALDLLPSFFFSVTVSGGFMTFPIENDNFIRWGYRNGGWVVDVTLTATGFAGVENTDWEQIGGQVL